MHPKTPISETQDSPRNTRTGTSGTERYASKLTSTSVKRIQIRLSEPTRAEIAFHFRNSGCRSWDEFMRKLLVHWNNPPRPPVTTVLEGEIQSVKDDIRTLMGQTGHFRLLMDGQTDALHDLYLSHQQLNAIVGRLNSFLQLAFELAGEKLPDQGQDGEDHSPEAEVFRKIRNRDLSD